MKNTRFTAICMAMVMGVSLVGCGGNQGAGNGGNGAGSAKAEAGTDNKENTGGNGDSGSNPDTTAEGAKDASQIKVGLVLSTGGLGDKNFNDMAYAGITKAQEDFGIEFDYVEPSSVSDLLPLDRQFAETEEYDLIIAIASDQEEPIIEVSQEFPDQKISLLDSAAEIDGVSTVQTEWSEQTFLAGVIAGMGTLSDMELANEDNVIGVIMEPEGRRCGIYGRRKVREPGRGSAGRRGRCI